MSRLVTCGFETGNLTPEVTANTGTAPAVITTSPASGNYCIQIGTTTLTGVYWAFTGAAARHYYFKCAFKFASGFTMGGANVQWMTWMNSAGTQLIAAAINSSKQMILLDHGNVQVGNASATLSPDTWYTFEMQTMWPVSGTGTMEGRLNGVVFATSTTANVTSGQVPGRVEVVNGGGVTGGSFSIDDVALNDDQGAAQNTYPGSTKQVLLLTASDSVIGSNWLVGSAATTNLFQAINHVPPTGLTFASRTSTSQIYNVTSSAATTAANKYTAQLAKYSDPLANGGGALQSYDTIQCTQAFATTSSSANAAISGGLQTISNPADSAEATGNTSATAGGTYPTNWVKLVGNVTSPGAEPDHNTGPTITVRKNTATTNALSVAIIGLYVDYLPGTAPSSSNPLVMVV